MSYFLAVDGHGNSYGTSLVSGSLSPNCLEVTER
jgi:hypothetical protein